MRYPYTLIVAVALVSLSGFFSGCSHTNNLGKYPVNGGRYIYLHTVAGGALSAHVSITPPDTTAAAGTMTSITEGISTGQLQAKLERVPSASLAAAVSHGLEEAMKNYLNAMQVSTMGDQPAFIVETTLKLYELHSTDHDAEAKVSASSRIVDRSTGGVVWENSETNVIQLRSAGPYQNTSGLATAAGYFNAARLMSMSDDEINTLLGRAADDAGHSMGETLREDVAKLAKK